MTLPDIEHLSPAEFLDYASSNKIGLVDALAAQLLVVGEECAIKTAEYHRQKAQGKVSPDLAYERYLFEVRYDTLRHAISALQSTLRAERGA